MSEKGERQWKRKYVHTTRKICFSIIRSLRGVTQKNFPSMHTR